MKAKEYAQIYKDAENKDETILRILNDFAQETLDLIKKRKCGTPVTVSSALNEQWDKWKAFCRQTDGVFDPEGFPRLVERTMPKLMPFWSQK
ncbi:MAG: hypothetical protein M3209_00370 [Acidobacteriota bacterium]|nr:hypothetical protein [Acidobacteriota bacterium]